ncbi:MAG: replicative DNA helicase [Magnetococcales bacterium]|nr:replicative DNA helicase [Magnetococcales bacterium]
MGYDAGIDGPASRQPAYSMEAEQSVLGAILLDNDTLDQVADVLAPDDFYVAAHRIVFKAIQTLDDRGEPADTVILKQYLEKQEELTSIGGAAYLAELVNTVPAIANVKAYARLVHDKSVLRELARQATGIVEGVYRDPRRKVDEVLDDAEQRIFSVAEGRDQRRSAYYDVKSILTPVFERIDKLMERKEAVTGVPSGYEDMDKMTAGLQPSDLIILAGRPSMGKTALAMNIAENAALGHKVGVGVFSLEMSKEQLVMRLLASTARVDAQGLRTGWIKDDEYGRLINAAGELSAAPLYIDDTPAISVMALRSKARRLKREKDIQMIVVDYLQLMTGSSGSSDNRVQEISEISRGLKSVAKELSIPVIALSQLSREVEKRPDKRPILSDLRESGAIEQDADVVMFVYREEVYKKDDPSLEGLAEAIIAKQRNGPVGAVKLTFLKKFTRFENHAAPQGF